MSDSVTPAMIAAGRSQLARTTAKRLTDARIRRFYLAMNAARTTPIDERPEIAIWDCYDKAEADACVHCGQSSPDHAPMELCGDGGGSVFKAAIDDEGLRQALLGGTISMTGNRVMVEFSERDEAVRFFHQLSAKPNVS